MTAWNFEADYFTACNCDWGCPCNFNARPNEGRCMGWGVWNILTGQYGTTSLDGTRLALYYKFPGPIENGEGTACAYVDAAASEQQRQALTAIGTGQAGGGIFGLFGAELVTTWLPSKFVPIRFDVHDGVGTVSIEGIGEAQSELLSYPDGSVIRPELHLPHGIEYKQGLMTNTRRWWWRDDDLLASYADRYGAVARVRFTEQGCVG
ncbi:DUF1326 domain-containing protein [Marinobacter sp. SS21]|uniref:DUF1326 domain-containing protein n=1 Tax=Marinobacter sp. SS21 TaxID=2979460 RepID=UPI00232D61A6|nr:DUF1326 domain-containing protein [Marinobacter sp. SS21]MDC0663655.1 DUF1326 domain-containing protein [Marinobacter sp. SS21]